MAEEGLSSASARQLADDAGKHYFLSRPRRFGKSLFVDTLKELYQGNEPLFRDLAVHDGWDWSRRHPVVRLSFAAGNFRRPDELLASTAEQLADIERETEASVAEAATVPRRFARLLAALHRRAGRRVVVLVDDLNNLIDITLDPGYSTICGYTEADLDTVFAPELPGLDRDLIRTWYNGYNWLGTETVYNPFGILKLFRSRAFKAHWFETATPRFLIDTLLRRGFSAPDLDAVHASEALLSSFDVDRIAPEASRRAPDRRGDQRGVAGSRGVRGRHLPGTMTGGGRPTRQLHVRPLPHRQSRIPPAGRAAACAHHSHWMTFRRHHG